MKKLFFTLVIFLGALSVSAQDIGQMWVGGHVGFGYTKPKDGDSRTSFTIMPEFGYVLQDNLGIGISLGYTHSKQGDIKGDSYKISPFLRYSFLKGDIGSLFVDGGVGYEHTKKEYPMSSAIISRKDALLDVGFRPGVAINISDKVTLTAKYGFLGYQYTKEGDAKANSFGFDFDLENCLFGVNFVF